MICILYNIRVLRILIKKGGGGPGGGGWCGWGSIQIVMTYVYNFLLVNKTSVEIGLWASYIYIYIYRL